MQSFENLNIPKTKNIEYIITKKVPSPPQKATDSDGFVDEIYQTTKGHITSYGIYIVPQALKCF